nr:40S ribosomal protein S27 [Tanacetum cinerariifolium]
MKEDSVYIDITKREKKTIWVNFNPNQKLNLKLLQQYPNSFFMDVRCNGCLYVTTIYSHPQEPIHCPCCLMNLCIPSKAAGGPCTLDDYCTFWRKTTKPFNAFVLDETLPTDYKC